MATRGWQSVTLSDIGMKAFPKQPAKAAHAPQERRSKYRAVKTSVNGWTFDSKAEAARYQHLLTLGAVGHVRNLELQPRFPIALNGRVIANYVADFRYEELDAFGWREVVEDVKGMKTPVYRLKKKLVEAQYGIQIREVR